MCWHTSTTWTDDLYPLDLDPSRQIYSRSVWSVWCSSMVPRGSRVNMHDLAHVSRVESILCRSWATSHNGRWGTIWSDISDISEVCIRSSCSPKESAKVAEFLSRNRGLEFEKSRPDSPIFPCPTRLRRCWTLHFRENIPKSKTLAYEMASDHVRNRLLLNTPEATAIICNCFDDGRMCVIIVCYARPKRDESVFLYWNCFCTAVHMCS